MDKNGVNCNECKQGYFLNQKNNFCVLNKYMKNDEIKVNIGNIPGKSIVKLTSEFIQFLNIYLPIPSMILLKTYFRQL